MSRYLTALVLLTLACSSPTEEPPAEASFGLYQASGRTDLDLFLYDETPGLDRPELFFVRQRGPQASVYWWGTFTADRNAIRFAMYEDTLRTPRPRITDPAPWLEFGESFTATHDGFGRVVWTRDPQGQ